MLSGTVERLPNGKFRATLEVQVDHPVGSLAEIESAEFDTEIEADAWIAARNAWKTEN
jgi:hypothetical protein